MFIPATYEHTEENLQVRIIAGAVVAGVILVAIIAVATVLYLRRYESFFYYQDLQH